MLSDINLIPDDLCPRKKTPLLWNHALCWETLVGKKSQNWQSYKILFFDCNISLKIVSQEYHYFKIKVKVKGVSKETGHIIS